MVLARLQMPSKPQLKSLLLLTAMLRLFQLSTKLSTSHSLLVMSRRFSRLQTTSPLPRRIPSQADMQQFSLLLLLKKALSTMCTKT